MRSSPLVLSRSSCFSISGSATERIVDVSCAALFVVENFRFCDLIDQALLTGIGIFDFLRKGCMQKFRCLCTMRASFISMHISWQLFIRSARFWRRIYSTTSVMRLCSDCFFFCVSFMFKKCKIAALLVVLKQSVRYSFSTFKFSSYGLCSAADHRYLRSFIGRGVLFAWFY